MHLTLFKFPVTVEVCYHRNYYSYDQLSAASIWLRTPVYNMKVGYILKERMQGVLSKHIARLRTNTARHTDERVRLAGEAIAGSLAVKMLGQSLLCCQAFRSVPCLAVNMLGQSPTMLSRF